MNHAAKFHVPLDYDAADELLVAILQEHLRTVVSNPKYIDDKKYQAKYVKAVNFVLEHFGGEPVMVKQN